MSRTKRAVRGDRWWLDARTAGLRPGWQWDAETMRGYWESDCPNRHGRLKELVKWDARKTRRAEERSEIHRVKRDREREYLDRRSDRGVLWHWD